MHGDEADRILLHMSCCSLANPSYVPNYVPLNKFSHTYGTEEVYNIWCHTATLSICCPVLLYYVISRGISGNCDICVGYDFQRSALFRRGIRSSWPGENSLLFLEDSSPDLTTACVRKREHARTYVGWRVVCASVCVWWLGRYLSNGKSTAFRNFCRRQQYYWNQGRKFVLWTKIYNDSRSLRWSRMVRYRAIWQNPNDWLRCSEDIHSMDDTSNRSSMLYFIGYILPAQ